MIVAVAVSVPEGDTVGVNPADCCPVGVRVTVTVGLAADVAGSVGVWLGGFGFVGSGVAWGGGYGFPVVGAGYGSPAWEVPPGASEFVAGLSLALAVGLGELAARVRVGWRKGIVEVALTCEGVQADRSKAAISTKLTENRLIFFGKVILSG